jgi:hypothetical protein
MATPSDELAFYDAPGFLDLLPPIDEVHVSVTFTWDIPHAERLAHEWGILGVPVKIGGPAMNEPGGEFIPGRHLKEGYVITSRGCPNHCWFCSVPKREGGLRELPITHGWNVLDDNLLACSDSHIRAVFAMLKQQPNKVEFTGGMEAKLLKPQHVELLRDLKPKQIFFAYDTPDDYEPLFVAGKMLLDAGFTTASHALRCYVLVGYPKDDMYTAEIRCHETMDAGFLPMAMLWRDEHGKYDPAWRRFQREWARPCITATK